MNNHWIDVEKHRPLGPRVKSPSILQGSLETDPLLHTTTRYSPRNFDTLNFFTEGRSSPLKIALWPGQKGLTTGETH